MRAVVVIGSNVWAKSALYPIKFSETEITDGQKVFEQSFINNAHNEYVCVYRLEFENKQIFFDQEFRIAAFATNEVVSVSLNTDTGILNLTPISDTTVRWNAVTKKIVSQNPPAPE